MGGARRGRRRRRPADSRLGRTDSSQLIQTPVVDLAFAFQHAASPGDAIAHRRRFPSSLPIRFVLGIVVNNSNSNNERASRAARSGELHRCRRSRPIVPLESLPRQPSSPACCYRFSTTFELILFRCFVLNQIVGFMARRASGRADERTRAQASESGAAEKGGGRPAGGGCQAARRTGAQVVRKGY
jgi:hypothetical protein